MLERKKVRAVLLTVLLGLVVVAFTGCISITAVNMPSGVPATSNYTITMTVKPTADLNNVRATLAMRVPNAWEVKTVSYSGSQSGSVAYSPTMANYFTTVWQTKPVDVSHNGPKPGYKWWAGYAVDTESVTTTDQMIITIVIDTHSASGSFLLDFVAGITSATWADKEDLASNGNGANWEIGGAITGQTGIKLNQAVTLTPSQPTFLDVGVSHLYFDAIEGMAKAGVINGYDVPGGKQFRPDNDVYRWQFAKMIDGALAIPVNEALVATFVDLGPDNPASLEPHDYVAAAANANIIKGYSDGTFRAYTSIGRAQVMTMIVRAMNSLHPGVLQAPPAGYTGSIAAFDTGEHTGNMRWAEFNGLTAGLQGFGAGWAPWQSMTRGEVAQALWNTMGLLP